MPRLLFEKKGNAVWISHLDLMRVFQRAFKRAGLHLTHTHGFNPRPSVSIALPLSVGTQSHCELLDFELAAQDITCQEIQQRLNAVLIDGVRVLSVYESGRKIRELSLLHCRITLKYAALPEGAQESIQQLFAAASLVVAKKTKSGIQDQDIIPMLRRLEITEQGSALVLNALVCCQNPTLNPSQLVAAIEKYLPEYKPELAEYARIEVYDSQEKIFR